MTSSLALARCLHHPSREAVCQCPICTRYFCRECVTEHGGRFLCSQCVAEMPAVAVPAHRLRAAFFESAATAAGFLLIVVFFYLMGFVTSIYGR